MAFSDQAIGFYLEAEDVNLTSTLAKAEKSWESYTKSLEAWNKRAFETTNKGLQAVRQLMEAAAALPEAAAGSVTKASALIARKIKPITQSVKLDVSARSTAGLRKVVGKAVMDAMEGANVRLTASMPSRRLAMFRDDVALRTAYQDIPQPPDMKGKIKPLKKFREGGVVEGPNKAMDSVLAMLQPGELVIPRELTQQLSRVGGRLLHRGTEVGGDEIKDLIKLTEKYGKELEPVADALARIDEEFVDMSFTAKQSLGSALLRTGKRAKDLRDEIEETSEVSEHWLGKVLTPLRFIAVDKALDKVQDGFQFLRGKASEAFSVADGQKIHSFVDAINQMNQYLGMSREELAGFKSRAFDAAAAIDGVSVDEFAYGLQQAAEAGIRNEDTMFAVAGAASAVAKATDIAADSAVKFGYEMTQSRGFAQETFEQILATNARLSKDFNVRASTLQEQTQANLTNLTATIESLTEEQGAMLLMSFNRIGAALPSSFVDSADEIQNILSSALEGDPDALRQAGLIFGKPINQIREDLVEGDVAGLFADLQGRIDGLNPQQIKAVSNAIGLSSSDLTKFAAAGDEIAESLERSRQSIIPAGDAAEYLRERAAGNRTVFEQWQEQLTKTIGGLELFGVKGIDVINFFSEFNLSQVLAIGYLSQFLKPLGSVVAKMSNLVGLTGTLGKMGNFAAGGFGSLGKGLLRSAGPLALVAGLATAVTMKISSLADEVVETNQYADKGAKAGLTEFGKVGADIMRVQKNIARVQKNVDLDIAAGREANPNAIMLLERYNGQLAELQARSQAMRDAARGGSGTPSIPADVMQNVPMPLTSGEMDQILNAQVSMGMDSGATEEKLDRSNELMAQMVGLMQQMVSRGTGAPTNEPPRRVVSGATGGGSSFGQSVARGDL